MRTIQEQAIESAGKLLMDYGINPPGETCDDPACDAHLNIRVRAAIERIESAEARAAALTAQLEAVTKERDALKRSISEALNSGSGVYRP